jgi:hypothetical protein
MPFNCRHYDMAPAAHGRVDGEVSILQTSLTLPRHGVERDDDSREPERQDGPRDRAGLVIGSTWLRILAASS